MQDSLPWIQMLNNENLRNVDLVTEFAVARYPTNILVYKNKIMGKYEGANNTSLYEKIKELTGR